MSQKNLSRVERRKAENFGKKKLTFLMLKNTKLIGNQIVKKGTYKSTTQVE